MGGQPDDIPHSIVPVIVKRRWALNKRAVSRCGSPKRVLLWFLWGLLSDALSFGGTRSLALVWRRSRPQDPSRNLTSIALRPRMNYDPVFMN
jgi:hypothetical protein